MEHDSELEGIQVSRAVTVTRHVLVVSTTIVVDSDSDSESEWKALSLRGPTRRAGVTVASESA